MKTDNRKYGYVTADPFTYKLLKGYAERMKKFPTDAEHLLWNYLRGKQLKYRFRRQYIVLDYIPDFICLPLKLIIEIDGGYHLEGEQPERDAERTHFLKEKGYTVLRFTNRDVFNDINSIILSIKKKMSELESVLISTLESNLISPPLEGQGGGLIIFSAPSGSGKSTIVKWLMDNHPELNLAFSVSATTRPPRGKEKNGVEYLFLSEEEFRKKIADGEFLEHEEVYPGRFYGTLKSQVDTQTERGENVVFDVDVKGGCNIKNFYGDRALSIFIQAPSVEVLRQRLEGRGTDSAEAINSRIAKASYEMTFAPRFDHVVVNDDLSKAEQDTYELVRQFLGR